MAVNNMYDFREGAKNQLPCAFCNKIVSTTVKNETLSLCEGLEEANDVLINICDKCGNITSTPARSVSPIQDAIKRLIESGGVSDSNEITIELKSIVERKKRLDRESRTDFQVEHTLVAAE